MKPEVWLRGPIEGIHPLLQPVAHALLQAREEVVELLVDFPEEKLWAKIAGKASVAFHLQHLTGVLDRLFTYARNEGLSSRQFAYLDQEGAESAAVSLRMLLSQFEAQVESAIEELKNTSPASLTENRGVGRAQLSGTVIGLLVHAAEHTMRHVGQLIVTIAGVKEHYQEKNKI